MYFQIQIQRSLQTFVFENFLKISRTLLPAHSQREVRWLTTNFRWMKWINCVWVWSRFVFFFVVVVMTSLASIELSVYVGHGLDSNSEKSGLSWRRLGLWGFVRLRFISSRERQRLSSFSGKFPLKMGGEIHSTLCGHVLLVGWLVGWSVAVSQMRHLIEY